jgi:uncharacterized protein (DUF1501 family)
MLSRRGFLQIAAIGGGVVALRHGLRLAHASPSDPQLMLLVYFEGGWDQMLVTDPRDNTDARFQREAAYRPGGSGIYPAYDLVLDPQVKALLASNARGVQTAGKITLGPAAPASLLAHASDLCVVRGMTMDTLTHEVGRRYFLTGKFPRGLAANGSAITSVVAALEGQGAVLPNMAIATESYAEDLPAAASPVRVLSAGDVLAALRPFGTPLDPASQEAMVAFEQMQTCEQERLDRDGLVKFFKDSKAKARTLTTSNVSTLFQFNAAAPPPEVAPLFDALGITTAADLAGPKGRAALAAQALANGVSQAVSVQLASGLDDHFDWDTDHATSLRNSFDALGRLITYLKSVKYKGTSESVWQHTTLMVSSEFSRTPLINSRGGRDHHLASSCLVAGPGIKGNTVIGGTTDVQLAARKVNPTTGQPDDKGVPLRPADVHATVLQSMGLSYGHISNQSPQILNAMLK